ncbi:MAG: hypothetical protein PVI97_12170 [Candidatus Thiodiazotropha sp.]|jgi:hypothetical protein
MLYWYLVFFSFLILSGCDNTVSTTESMNIAVYDELGILPKLISLPKQPLSVKWQVDESAERGTGSLRALLEFSASDKAYILENSPQFDSISNDRISAEFYDTWLPDRAKNGIKKQAVDNMYELSGIEALKADLFTKADLSPYVNGSVTPLSGGYILVSLYAL